MQRKQKDNQLSHILSAQNSMTISQENEIIFKNHFRVDGYRHCQLLSQFNRNRIQTTRVQV